MDYQGRVLVVEDDRDMGALLQSYLDHEGFRSEVVAEPETAVRLVEQFFFDAILLDLHLGAANGLDLLPRLARMSPFTKVIVMTAFGSIDLAVDSMERGATTFMTKGDSPLPIVEELKRRLAPRPSPGQPPVAEVASQLGIIGESPRLKDILQQIEQLRDVDATVLLMGESGTGKELIARAIHLVSDRKAKPFEAINCGAIPDNLLEAELFGYRKGAFTDARTDRKGMFELCGEGSLFLDEIGEVPLALQVKLLRVLQEREVRPIGANQTIKVEARVIAATNRDLETEVREGRFREDLFFRLSVFPVILPPLRERREDIPLLAEYFVRRFSERYRRNVAPPGPEVLNALLAHDWPGNIRELQNCMERAVVLARDGEIHGEHVFGRGGRGREPAGGDGGIDTLVYAEAKEHFERGFLRKILQITRGNISEAARLSGRFRSDIYRLMERYGISHRDFREP